MEEEVPETMSNGHFGETKRAGASMDAADGWNCVCRCCRDCGEEYRAVHRKQSERSSGDRSG